MHPVMDFIRGRTTAAAGSHSSAVFSISLVSTAMLYEANDVDWQQIASHFCILRATAYAINQDTETRLTVTVVNNLFFFRHSRLSKSCKLLDTPASSR